MPITKEDFKPSSSRKFCDVDPFNKNYMLSGRICQTGNINGNTYGAMLIETITQLNTDLKEEYPDGGYIVGATPKLKYPFTQDLKYRFPSASKIEVFRKYDGTNIYMYRYPNILGGWNITYKTRALPFTRPEFEAMWRNMLDKYEDISNLFDMNPDLDGFSFELYGTINHHMIQYKESLETKLLFARKGDDIVSCENVEVGNVARAEKICEVQDNYVWEYQQHQSTLEDALVATEDGFKGDEGYIWYLTQQENGFTRMYKCKPPTVEKIHWSNTTIPKSIVRTTAQNALESIDEVDFDILKEMLLEDFTETQIDLSIPRMKQIMFEVNEAHKMKMKVKDMLKEYDYLNMPMNQLMPKIAGKFNKQEMRKVGSFVVSLKEAAVKLL